MALTFDEKLIPGWAAGSCAAEYLRGEAAQFIVHGNVSDLVLYQGELLAVTDFLCQVMLAGEQRCHRAVQHCDRRSLCQTKQKIRRAR